MSGGDTRAADVPIYTRMVLSGFSGMGAATVCHPLDVVRVQAQNTTGRPCPAARAGIHTPARAATQQTRRPCPLRPPPLRHYPPPSPLKLVGVQCAELGAREWQRGR